MIITFLLSAAPAAAACPTPASWSAAIPAGSRLRPPSNEVRFERGAITWNRIPIDDETLELYLSMTAKLEPQPRLTVDTAQMDCATLARVATIAQRAGLDCTDGHCVAMDLPYKAPLAPPSPPLPPLRR